MPSIYPSQVSIVSWTDALCPAHAAGSGVSAPSYTTDWIAETGSNDNELRIPTFNPGDRVYCSLQIPHDLYRPALGTLTFRPHVHWCFVSEPTTARTVIWELRYMVAKPNATFASAVTSLTATAYTTTADAEINVHRITSLGDIEINIADFGPSMIFICNLGLKDTSTVDSGKTGLLSFDFHYQTQPMGTVTEFA